MRSTQTTVKPQVCQNIVLFNQMYVCMCVLPLTCLVKAPLAALRPPSRVDPCRREAQHVCMVDALAIFMLVSFDATCPLHIKKR